MRDIEMFESTRIISIPLSHSYWQFPPASAQCQPSDTNERKPFELLQAFSPDLRVVLLNMQIKGLDQPIWPGHPLTFRNPEKLPMFRVFNHNLHPLHEGSVGDSYR
jgi:hypothetical protein